MYGSDTFKILSGSREQIGYKTMDLPVSLSIHAEAKIPRGTWIDDYVSGSTIDDTTGVLASGFAIGFITNDVDANGLTGLQGFQNMIIGKLDNPVKNGYEVAVAKPSVGAEFEVEGAGGALPGNLVATTGTGALADDTARKTQLSFFNGCIRIAQTNDHIQMILLEPNLTPVVDGNLRIRVQWVGNAGIKG